MKTIRKTLLALAALALTAGAAQASIVNYSFTGAFDSGPATGQTFSGSFSYTDDSLNGVADELVGLDSLVFTALGSTFTKSMAVDAPLAAFYDGSFVGIDASYIFADGGGFAFIDGYFDLSSAYAAYQPLTGGGSIGSYSVTAVPEPAALALSLAGLGAAGLAMSRRRRRQASAAV